MTNNTRNPNNYHSQQDMRKLSNNKNPNMASLPRQANNWQQQQESSLTQNHIYSQPLVPNGVGSFLSSTPKFNTTDRHIRLTQDHFNHNQTPVTAALQLKYPQLYPQSLDGDYLHNNSHYALPVDHSLPERDDDDHHHDDHNASPTSSSPTPPTPPPPALPLRNGSCNTTGRRSTLSSLNGNALNNNNNNSVATLQKNKTLNNNINNNTGSLRHQYH